MNVLKLVSIVFAILLIIFYLTSRDSLNSSLACQDLRYFKKTEFRGVVVEKYMDQKNHRAETIRIKRTSDTFNFVLPVDSSSIYEYVESGDSLVKMKDKENVDVYRKDLIKRFKIYFGCSD